MPRSIAPILFFEFPSVKFLILYNDTTYTVCYYLDENALVSVLVS